MIQWQQSIQRTEWPRILFVEQDYLVVPELLSAMRQLGVEHATVSFRQDASFLREFFNTLEAFHPDFILTVNHAGLDAQGEVLRLLKQAGIPLASWFVDRHEMFMRNRASADSLLAVFSWDPDAVSSLAAQGVAYAGYLPLAANVDCFRRPSVPTEPLRSVAFIGSSWRGKVADLRVAGQFPDELLRQSERLAQQWAVTPHEPVFRLLRADAAAYNAWKSLTDEKRLMLLRLVQLQATSLHRIDCVRELLPFSPLIVGDAHWKQVLADDSFSWCDRISYRDELPQFYGDNIVNFNVNSLQSRHAQNQRIFDVPSCGAFVFSQQSRSLEELFEPGLEVACYQDKDDIRPSVEKWLADTEARKRIVEAGYRRVMAHHTYMHRVDKIVSAMEQTF